jgi:hypothetical protein
VPAALAPDQCQDLLDHLAQLTDPRQRRGRRHTLGAVLAVAVAAVLAGARSLTAIGEWAADAPGPVLAALEVRRHPLTGAWRSPAEATVRRVLAALSRREPIHNFRSYLVRGRLTAVPTSVPRTSVPTVRSEARSSDKPWPRRRLKEPS